MTEFNTLYGIAKSSAQSAYAPYSNFRVGAALLSTTGEVFSGNNIENASYSLTCCAERVAIFKAVSHGITDFKMLVITADTNKPISPCGACRQVMNEFFDDKVEIILTNYENKIKRFTIKELLPYSFDL